MGRLFLISLESPYYTCKYCFTPLGIPDDIISKALHCDYGNAFLFRNIVNITIDEKVNPVVMIGMGALGGLQRVVEVFCVDCGSNVGWRYEVADELSLRYKQKKFMLVRNRLLDPWEHACITGLIDDSDNTDDA